MNSSNLNIVLSNALCCSSQLATKVSKLYDTGNLCVDTEFNKLKLLVDRINTLKCYDFPTEITTSNINSEFFTTLLEFQIVQLLSSVNLIIQLNVDGTIYTLISSKEGDTGFELIINKLTELGILVSYLIPEIEGGEFSLVLICSILNVSFTLQVSDGIPSQFLFTNTVPGMCPQTIITPAQNCLTEEQANIMMHDVMRQCDICDCQLTT